MKLLGAIIAGGDSTRFGSPKMLAQVNGVRIVDRVAAALEQVVPECVAIVNDAGIAAELKLPSRPDAVEGGGAVAGLLTALCWAHERGDDGILAVGADMPFIAVSLLAALAAELERTGADAVLPESGGRRGVEPLCAAYSIRCVTAIAEALRSGDHRMIGFHDSIAVSRLAADEVRRHGDAKTIFFNVNTRADRDTAERLAARSP